MIKEITAQGVIYGNPTLFSCKPNREGKYELARKVGREPGTRPQDLQNKVYVDSLEEALKLLKTSTINIVLSGKVFGIHRKSLRSIDSVDIAYHDTETTSLV